MSMPSNSSTPKTLRVVIQRKFGGFFLAKKPVTLVRETPTTTSAVEALTDTWGTAEFPIADPDALYWVEAEGKRLGRALVSWNPVTNLRFLI